MNIKLNKELDKLSLEELRNLADLMDVGINFNEDENKIKDLKGEIAFILSLESENKIKQGLEKLKK